MRRMGDRERRRLMSSISITLSTLRKTAGHRHTPVRAVVPVWDAAHGGQSCPATKCEMKQKAMEEALKEHLGGRNKIRFYHPEEVYRKV